MKTTTTIKQGILALGITFSIIACKKEKKDPDPTPPTEVKAITLTDLKALSTDASVKVPDGKKISGIVISDVSGKNTDSKTLVLQEATDKPGIIIYFDAAQTFALGDQLEVNISNQTMAQVNGEIVLNNVPVINAKKTGTGIIAAKMTTAAAIATNKASWDGTLVQLPAGAYSGGNGKFIGTLTYTDTTGAVKSNVLAGASFENTDYSTSIDGITGIVRINGNDVRVDVRNATDVNTAVKYLVTEDFKNVTVNRPNGRVTSYTTTNGQYNVLNAENNYIFPLAGDDFLDQSKKYIYLTQPDYISTVTSETVNLKGLKTIGVNFAGSKYTGNIDINAPGEPNGSDIKNVLPFDPSKHKIGINLYAYSDNFGAFPLETYEFNAVGQFNTITFKFPTSVDEFANMIVTTKIPDWAGVFSLDDAKLLAADFMANIKIGVSNHSVNRVTNKDNYQGDNPAAKNDSQPIVIDKIVFGFNVKP
ncbi:MAG: DUF5689 domain-containing protein [Chitinophagaceae bacterium]